MKIFAIAKLKKKQVQKTCRFNARSGFTSEGRYEDGWSEGKHVQRDASF